MFSATFDFSSDLIMSRMMADLRVTRNASAILAMQPALTELGRRVGQAGAVDDLRYFLSWLELRGKKPCLVTLGRDSSFAEDGSFNHLEAAVLLYEHCVSGFGLGIYASCDGIGRRALVPPAIDSSRFALEVCGVLLDQGARGILLSFRHEEAFFDPSQMPILCGGMKIRWASRERTTPSYLLLRRTVNETLEQMGARTRKHLRYYRRRAESQLGCEFVAEATIERGEFLELNRNSSYPCDSETAAWQYDAIHMASDPVFCGLRDRDGRWLSVACGLRSNRNMEVFWQTNRNDMKPYSLATVMRAFLIEHEIKKGTRRLFFQGGTSHSMSHSFVEERCTDLMVMRDSFIGRAIPSLFERYIPRENPINEFLVEPGLAWNMLR
ncbi:MAG: GNAT family N-acetyltransferase [Edaphobacter sp.]|uniref:GNAT family N-acetyltransferase n=1 Tax=Edaphobacter sp. TaxID=1934404 RepID=UPI0023A4A8C6|nr:GNAT family N-acetyltransferase [Edaphobacter sp.]MDE1178732.1 GNAT family N-acetyltransferase [Edaphobacter sp.]